MTPTNLLLFSLYLDIYNNYQNWFATLQLKHCVTCGISNQKLSHHIWNKLILY